MRCAGALQCKDPPPQPNRTINSCPDSCTLPITNQVAEKFSSMAFPEQDVRGPVCPPSQCAHADAESPPRSAIVSVEASEQQTERG